MPVDLPSAVSGKERPSSPNALVWMAIFIIFMMIGIVVAVLTWPKNQATGTPLFWLRLLAFPAFAWGIVFGLYRHFYDEDCNRIDAEDKMRQADREEAILFGSEPLAILGHAYFCGMGTKDASNEILQKKTILSLRASRPGKALVRHTSLNISTDEDEDGENKIEEGRNPEDASKEYARRLHAVFEQLLDDLVAPLEALPPKILFDVRLQCPVNINSQAMKNVWRACWTERNFRPAEPTLLCADEGLMCLDAWLDIAGGPALEKATLIVAVQLHENPPENSAEAAAAVLLGWPPLAERHDLPMEAMLHRPVVAELADLTDAFRLSLLWGRTDASALKHVWQTGLLSDDKPALLKTAPEGESDPASANEPEEPQESEEPNEQIRHHDLDTALGHPGAAASWLALALATEHIWQSNTPQLIAVRESSLRLAVIKPADQRHRKETNEMDEQA